MWKDKLSKNYIDTWKRSDVDVYTWQFTQKLLTFHKKNKNLLKLNDSCVDWSFAD